MKLRKAVRYAQPLQRPLWVQRRNTRYEQMTSALALATDIQRLLLHVRFVPKSRIMIVGGLGPSAAGLTFNLEPLLTSAAHTGELFEEPVRIDQRVGFARLSRRQPVVSFRQSV